MHRLLIVSVNYRTADLAIKCIESVYNQRDQLPETKMVVVDNDSQDGSYEKISAALGEHGWSDMIEVVDAGKNGGFSFGNNYAIRPAMASDTPPDFVWLLNPDAHLKEGAGTALIDFFEKHPKAGFATSACVDPSGELQTMAFRKFTPMGEFVGSMRLGFLEKMFPQSLVAIQPSPEPHQADWLSGSSLMMRKEVFDDLGLMDEEYFLYFEESDFCLQAQRRGWELWYVPESEIFHVIGASTGVTEGTAKKDSKSKRRPAYWFYSRRRYYVKNFSKLHAIYADFMHILGYSLWTLRRVVQRKPNLDPPNYLSDFFKNSVFVKGFKL